MTAATLSNVQTTIAKAQQINWTAVIEAQRSAAEARVNESISTAKVAAAEARSQATVAVKEQAKEAVLSITLLVPLFIVCAVFLACSHANVMMVARMVPTALVGIVAFMLFNLFLSGNKN